MIPVAKLVWLATYTVALHHALASGLIMQPDAGNILAKVAENAVAAFHKAFP